MVRCLGQLDQDLVVVPVQPVRVQVTVKLAQEQLRQVNGSAPRLLLVSAQPARLSVGPGHNTNLPLSRGYGDNVPAGPPASGTNRAPASSAWQCVSCSRASASCLVSPSSPSSGTHASR